MTEQEALTPEEKHDLVAYLDGELDEEAARALEAKLSRSPVARREAETLQRTWEMLDYLPRPKAPENFTHRTLQRLEVHRQTVVVHLRRWRWLARASWAAAVIAVAFLGFALSRKAQPSEDDVRILKYRPYYEQIDNIEFLHELAQPDLFGEDS